MTQPAQSLQNAQERHDRADLCALMDGALDLDSTAEICRRWRQDSDLQAQWHSYHLIGDVLRSPELAQHSAADADFLKGVRARLAQEPVVLAPAPVTTTVTAPTAAPSTTPAVTGSNVRLLRLRRWAAPVGMAAGVALVAGAVLVTRPGGLGDDSLITASLRQGTPAVQNLPLSTATEVQPVAVADPNAPPRDTELERYLNAHQQFPGTAALGPAPGFLRSAAYEPVPAR